MKTRRELTHLYYPRMNQTRIINPHKFGEASFDPASIAGLTCWYDAGAIAGLSDLDAVTAWPDSSGNGNDMASISASAPSYSITAINSLPAVKWADSASRGLESTLSASVTGDYLTGFAVVKVDSSAPTNGRVINCTSSGAVEDFDSVERAALMLTSGSASIYSFRTAGKSLGSVGNVFRVVISIYDGTNHTTRVNGVAASSVASTGSFNFSVSRLGLNRDGNGQFVGEIAEVGFYAAALSGGDLTALESYLATKYNL